MQVVWVSENVAVVVGLERTRDSDEGRRPLVVVPADFDDGNGSAGGEAREGVVAFGAGPCSGRGKAASELCVEDDEVSGDVAIPRCVTVVSIENGSVDTCRLTSKLVL